MTTARSSRPSPGTSPGAKPGKLLAEIASMAVALAGAVVVITLMLVALDGHPAGLLTIPAGATVPVILWSVWKLFTRLDRVLRSRRYASLALAKSPAGATIVELEQAKLAHRKLIITLSSDALPASQEAVRIYRELAEANPDRYRPDLAASLSNLGLLLTEMEALHSGVRRTEPTETEPLEAVQAEDLADADGAIRRFFAENPAHEDLWLRSVHAADEARRAQTAASLAESKAKALRLAHLAIQAENPERRAPRPRQLVIVGVMAVLNAGACYYAAQGLRTRGPGTLAWTGMFLAVLVGGELALNYFRDRSLKRTRWRVLALGLAAFVAGLGALRYYYVATILGNDALAAVVGSALLVLVTATLMAGGYWALRSAETSATSRARRQARRAAKAAEAARERADRQMRTRERLVDAYIGRIRGRLLQDQPGSRLLRIEAVIRARLLGEEPADIARRSRLRHEQEHRRNPAQDSG